MARLTQDNNVNKEKVPDYVDKMDEPRPFQIDMYGKYTRDSQYSNAIYYQDQMPWFAYSRNVILREMTSAKDARLVNKTEINNEPYLCELEPAMFSNEEDDSVFWRYPAKREEMVLEALKKIATNKGQAYVHEGSVGVFFTLSGVNKILNRRYNTNEIKEALMVMASAKVTIKEIGSNDQGNVSHMITSLYLSSHKEWAANSDCKCFAKFHDLTTKSIKDGLYRRIDLAIMNEMKANLSSLIYKRLVLKFIQASQSERYSISVIRLLKEAGFVYQVGPYIHEFHDSNGIKQKKKKTRYYRDIVKPVTRALEELKRHGIIKSFEEINVSNGSFGGRKEMQVDGVIEIIPAKKFIDDQIQANAELIDYETRKNLASENPDKKKAIDSMEPADFSAITGLSIAAVKKIRESKQAQLELDGQAQGA